MKWYVSGVAGAAGVSLVGIIVIIFNTDPKTASGAVKALYFASLFLFLWSLLTLGGYWLKSRIRSRQHRLLTETDFNRSAVSGFVIALIAIGYLIIKRIF